MVFVHFRCHVRIHHNFLTEDEKKRLSNAPKMYTKNRITRYIAIMDDIYDDLRKMKPDKDRSFSFVIKQLMNENKKLTEENKKLDKIIKEVIEKKDIVIEENQRLYKEMGDKGKGFLGINILKK